MASTMSQWIWAARLGGVPFGSLREGECFYFPGMDPAIMRAYTKLARGWYTDGTGRKFRTGSATAVVRAPRGA